MSALAASSPQVKGQLAAEEAATLCRRIESELAACGRRALTKITCRFQQGVLTLEGEVPSFYLKQLAQEVAGKADQSGKIENQLLVSDYLQPGPSSMLA